MLMKSLTPRNQLQEGECFQSGTKV